MKKYTLFFTLLQVLIGATLCIAQPGMWKWINGSNFVGASPVYGTQGVPCSNCTPGGLYAPCQWTDTMGNFWLFGGAIAGDSVVSALWKYNPAANEWTWVKGPKTENDSGYYGTRGIPSVFNNPPARGFGAATWTDKNNNLWLFGGVSVYTPALFNDLWKYNIATNMWTWVNGPDYFSLSEFGNYGSQLVPDTSNLPPNRYGTTASWVDNNGDLWFFGGRTWIEGFSFNDLWKYSIDSNIWTWMKGSDIPDQQGIYGTKGVEDPANVPGARAVYSHWRDKQGNFWLFGGSEGSGGNFNDMWQFSPLTNNWKWMSGSNDTAFAGDFGTQCVVNSSNLPYNRYDNPACWTDAKGDFWMFGGSTGYPVVRNDLWKYCNVSNEWVYESGDSNGNPVGNWGIKGVASPTNKPNGRAGSAGWSDRNGNLYFFGGTDFSSYYYYNDLWMFNIDATCGVCNSAITPVAAFSHSLCDSIVANDCLQFIDTSANNPTSWHWIFDGALPSSSTDQNPSLICYTTPGSFNVTLIASNAAGSDTLTKLNYIVVLPAPTTPSLTLSSSCDTLFINTDSSYSIYQWYDSTSLIPGATDTMLVITHSGNYNIRIGAVYPCNDTEYIALGMNVICVGIDEVIDRSNVNIYPNPASFNLQWAMGNEQNANSKMQIGIYDVLGQKMSDPIVIHEKSGVVNIDVSVLPAGIYFLQLKTEKRSIVQRFVKQ